MKQSLRPVVGEVAKPTVVGLDELDGTVEPFSKGIDDFVLTEAKQTSLMTSELMTTFFTETSRQRRALVGQASKKRLAQPL